MSGCNYEATLADHHEKWRGFDIYYREGGPKGTCLRYYCRVTYESDHAFDLDGSVNLVTLASEQHGMLESIEELTLARARAIIDLRSFEWGQTLERSLHFPRTSDNPEISNDQLRQKLLEVFHALRNALPLSYNAAEGRVDIDGLCIELQISKNQYLSAMNYLLGKGWLKRFVERPDNYSQVYITEEGIDEYERQASVGQITEIPAKRPDFSFITDSDLGSIIERDYDEIRRCLGAEAHKAATVMCGSVMEALLLDALLMDEPNAKQSPTAPKDRKGKVIKDLGHWPLSSMIEVAVDLGIIPKDTHGLMSHAVREYRNLIHPAVEMRKKIAAEREEANAAHAALDLIIKSLP